jgi:hypothetical protein
MPLTRRFDMAELLLLGVVVLVGCFSFREVSMIALLNGEEGS